MSTTELILKTIFCCMVCDGRIVPEEVAFIQSYANKDKRFEGLDVSNILNTYISELNEGGQVFMSNFLNEIDSAALDEEEQLWLLKSAIETIESDATTDYSEVRFFKEVRNRLSVSDDAILNILPGREDYLLPDIVRKDYSFSFNAAFDNIILS